jgi:hypothetical protein
MENPSELYRGADGLPNGSHRNRAIGNSIYPPIAALIGDAIKAAQGRRLKAEHGEVRNRE